MVLTSIRHTAVKSGAWNKSLEKLTTVAGVRRKLTAKRMSKAREAISNLQRQQQEEKRTCARRGRSKRRRNLG